MKAIYLKRLRKVIEAVESMPPPKFDMSEWFRGDLDKADDPECGTAACAVGSFCVKNPRSPLKLKRDTFYQSRWQIHYDGLEAGDAAAEFFGITTDDVELLFDESSYRRPTKSVVLGRLRSFVATKEREAQR